jgi:hypothetical protein
MAQANHSLSQIQARITAASFVLALQRARNAVKEELKRQRRRLADVEAKEITALAREYLDAHPELVADARPVVESWIARGVFGKRAQRAWAGRANLTSDAQSQSEPISTTSAVQMSGAQ